MRSAFGFGGQKCSANSRVYVERSVLRRVRPAAGGEDRERQDRRPARPRRLPRPGDRRGARWPRSRRRRTRRRSTAPSSPAASGSPTATSREGYFVAADRRRGLPPRLAGPEERAVRAVRRGRAGRRARRGDRAWPTTPSYGLTAGFYSEDRGRGRPVPRRDRGRRRVREPAGRRDDRRVAGRPAVRRLEGIGHHRQGRRRPVLRAAVPARAVPHGDRGVSTAETLDRQGCGATRRGAAALVTELPGPAGAGAGSSATTRSRARRSRAPTRSCPCAATARRSRTSTATCSSTSPPASRSTRPATRTRRSSRRSRSRPRELLHSRPSDFYLPIYPEVCRAARRARADRRARLARSSATPAPRPSRRAIKLARYATGRQYVVAFLGAFHGRTYGASRSPRPRRSTTPASGRCCRASSTRRTATVEHLERFDDVLRQLVPAERGRGDHRRARSRARAATSSRPRTGSCGPARALRPARHPAHRRRGPVAGSAAPARCGRSSTGASSPTSC